MGTPHSRGCLPWVISSTSRPSWRHRTTPASEAASTISTGTGSRKDDTACRALGPRTKVAVDIGQLARELAARSLSAARRTMVSPATLHSGMKGGRPSAQAKVLWRRIRREPGRGYRRRRGLIDLRLEPTAHRSETPSLPDDRVGPALSRRSLPTADVPVPPDRYAGLTSTSWDQSSLSRRQPMPLDRIILTQAGPRDE
jgi:hypothetical protein